MSGLVCGLIVIVHEAGSCKSGCLIQLILSELEHRADGHVDIADQHFRHLNSYLGHR